MDALISVDNNMNSFQHLLAILEELDNKGIYYRLNKVNTENDTILIEMAIPGERWEIEIDIQNTVYIEKYVSDDEVDFGTLTYNDYLERAALQFDGAIKMMTNVLYVFAAISVFVSAILNAILTYISIHQRTNEIGLLRSLGARKKDIGIMVETESLLCGLFGGVLSIILAASFVYPVNQMLTRAIYQYNFYILAKTTFTLPGFQWWVAPIMLGLGIATALISALIPAIIASKKDPAHAINE